MATPFKNIADVFFWFRIFIAPFLLFVIAAFFVYQFFAGMLGVVIAISTLILGVIISTIITEWIRKKYGAVGFMSRVIATPELNQEEDTQANP